MKYVKDYVFMDTSYSDRDKVQDLLNRIIVDKYEFDLVMNGNSIEIWNFRLAYNGELRNIPNHILYKLKISTGCTRIEFKIIKKRELNEA